MKLNRYPPEGVKEEDVKVMMEGNIDKHAVMSWKDPKSGRQQSAYTPVFMKANAMIKWKRIEKIKDSGVESIGEKSIGMLKKKDPITQEAGAIIGIIKLTGLRPGSEGGLKSTGNRGVSTLGPDNISIDGDKVTLNFVGKSYKENNAEFTNPELAAYLSKKLIQRKGKDTLFDITPNQLQTEFHQIAKKGMKVKDLRSYSATKMAASVLHNDTAAPPPPVDANMSPTKLKKLIKTKLKRLYEVVSQKLNNTPAMAKSSYIHPHVIEDWLKSMGIEPELAESTYRDFAKILYEVEDTSETDSKKITAKAEDIKEEDMNQEDLENCDEYPLPDWWDNEKIQLVVTKK